MGLIVGSARMGENGHITGGAAGDQTGMEVSTQAYYMHSKGWYCLRPKSASVAGKIAIAMKQACDNIYIGYDQNNRNGVITQLKKYGTLAAIKEKTESDCSSLIRACVLQATGKDVGDMYTGNLASVLESSGLFEKRKSVGSATVLYNGDVLVTKSKGHTVIVVSGRSRENSNNENNSTNAGGKGYMFSCPDLVKGNNGAAVELLQRLLIGHGYSVGASGVDGSMGADTEAAVAKFQKDKKIKVNYPGTVGSKTWRKLIGL